MNEQVSFTLRGRNPDVLTCIANLSNDWTAQHQMSINGKRDGFTLADFRACVKNAMMKRGRCDTILEEVRMAVAQWKDYAEQANVPESWREQIQRNLRLSLPRSS